MRRLVIGNEQVLESIYYRSLIAHNNHNNMPLIDRQVFRYSVDVREMVRQKVWEVDCLVKKIIRNE